MCTLKQYPRIVNNNYFAHYCEAVFSILWNTIVRPVQITRITLPDNICYSLFIVLSINVLFNGKDGFYNVRED